MERRDFLRSGVAAGAVLVGGACARSGAVAGGPAAFTAPLAHAEPAHVAGLKQSVCKWCYPKQSVAELAAAARRIGLRSVELLGPEDWPVLKEHGLICALSSQPGPGGIPKGFNRVENHEWLIPAYRQRIREAAEAGVPNVICFSGNREGMDDQEGLQNCLRGVKQIVGDAERQGVMVVMELLNSRIDHHDYMCDHTAWGVELVKAVGSPHFKLLYDIYHMQIMEGDVIRTIRDNHEYIAHYHTGGVPGRHEIDASQELYWPAVMRAIAETGYDGYVAQEFVPTRDPLTSLAEAYRICTV
ncbi:MAG TPA: TIM barrel protein [Longimicrobiaceae bacterium]|nr:TIM barrel protein [Longimicrobiaceae bacterium]